MEVAKSYENLERLCEPFEENGKGYVIVKLVSGKEKKVRFYGKINKANYKVARGFVNGYIHAICGGSLASHEDWLNSTVEAWANVPIGWFVPSNYDYLPEPPQDIYYIKLLWEEIGNEHIDDRAYIQNLIKQKQKERSI